MSDRVRVEPELRSPTNAPPSPEDVRRKLEGRVEAVEAALGRYTALESVLNSGRWKRRLRQAHGAVHELLAHEAAVAEALTRIRRRAESEGWPEDTPVLATVRDVTARRARLEALVRQRLEKLAPPTGEPSLEEDLARLEGLVLQPIPLEPAPGEVRLLQQTKQDPDQGPLIGKLYLLTLTFVALAHGAMKLLGPPAFLAVLAAYVVPLVLFGLRTGAYWLTSDRLVWKPLLGEPVAVPLRSIRPGGVRVQPRLGTVHVEGERTAHVRHILESERLAAFLELHRQPPLLGASRAGLRLGEVAFYPAELREGGTVRHGLAVLRPRYVAFLPREAGAAVLQAVTGAPVPPGRRVEAEWVVDQLRWLPAEEFDAVLERVLPAVKGVRWSAFDARHRAGMPVWKDIRLERGAQVLSGKVDWAQQAAAEKVLGFWTS